MTAGMVMVLIAVVSALSWRPPEEAPDTLGDGVTWVIWSGAVVVACLAAAVVFRRERELRIGILQGVALGLAAVLAVLWLGLSTASSPG